MPTHQDHLYECPTEPNKGLILVYPRTSDDSRCGTPGNIWCWSHGRWEDIPDLWYEKEEELRTRVDEEWEHVRSTGEPRAFRSTSLTEKITEYCHHRGWKVPDLEDRYEVCSFIRDLGEHKPVR